MKGRIGEMAKKSVGRKPRKPTAAQIKAKGTFEVGERSKPIPAGVWGQLAPLDKVARDKASKWGDSLPELVSPELAGRFHGAYEALGAAVEAEDVVKVNKLAGALMRAWDVLEAEALAAGHEPLPNDAYCIDLGDGRVTCIAMHGASELRRLHPKWAVYSFEDAARVLAANFASDFIEEAFKAFPDAKVTRVDVGEWKDPRVDREIDDEIPF
jgi:hypothetical protein